MLNTLGMVKSTPRVANHIGSPMKCNRSYNDVLSKYLVDHSAGYRVQALGAPSVVGKVAVDVHRSVHNSSISIIACKRLTLMVDSLLALAMIEAHCVRHRCDDYLP